MSSSRIWAIFCDNIMRPVLCKMAFFRNRLNKFTNCIFAVSTNYCNISQIPKSWFRWDTEIRYTVLSRRKQIIFRTTVAINFFYQNRLCHTQLTMSVRKRKLPIFYSVIYGASHRRNLGAGKENIYTPYPQNTYFPNVTFPRNTRKVFGKVRR